MGGTVSFGDLLLEIYCFCLQDDFGMARKPGRRYEKRKNRSFLSCWPRGQAAEEFNFLDLNLFLSANILEMLIKTGELHPVRPARRSGRCHTY